MFFRKLEVCNFMAYAKAKVDLARCGLVLVTADNQDCVSMGSNGGGKSALIVEAPLWCLFGKTVRGQRGNEVVKTGSKGSYVQLVIGDLFEQDVTVIRYQDHPQCGNDLVVYVGNDQVQVADKRDLQGWLIEKLGFDFDLARQCFVVGQGGIPFASTTDSQKKQALELALGLSVFPKYLEETNARIRVLEVEQTTAVQSMGVKQVQISRLKTEIEGLEIAQAKFDSEKDEELVGLGYKLVGLGVVTVLPQTSAGIQSAVQQLQERKVQVIESEKRVKSAEQEARPLRSKVAVFSNQLQTMQNLYDKVKQAIQEVQVDAPCSRCGKIMTVKDVELITRVEREQLEKIREELTTLQQEFQVVSQRLLELEGIASQGESGPGEAAIAGSIALLETMVKVHGRESTSRDQIQEKQKQLTDLDFQLAEEANQRKTFEQQLESLKFWEVGFGNQGLKSLILDHVAPYLNERANEYAKVLTEGEENIEFTTQVQLKSGEKRDKFDVKVEVAGGSSQYAGTSRGEGTRVDICCALALRDLVATRATAPVDFVAFDEPFDGLDAEGKERLLKLLVNQAQTHKTVFVMTHDATIAPMFKEVLHIRKKNGTARVM